MDRRECGSDSQNIYGVTKTAAEDLCALFHQLPRLPCIVLRTSRFFPEADDDPVVRDTYDDTNLKVNELLFRRVDVEDVVSAHLQAAANAGATGLGRYVISATTPFSRDDLLVHEANVQVADLRQIDGRPALWIGSEQLLLAKKLRRAVE